MKQKTGADGDRGRIKRRDFVRSGGAALAGGVVLGRPPIPESTAMGSRPSVSNWSRRRIPKVGGFTPALAPI